MKELLVIITAGLLCFSCGVKSKPEYEPQAQYNSIYKI